MQFNLRSLFPYEKIGALSLVSVYLVCCPQCLKDSFLKMLFYHCISLFISIHVAKTKDKQQSGNVMI